MKRVIFLMFLMLGMVGCSDSPKSGYLKKETVGTLTESDFDRMIEISNRKDANAFGQMIMEGKMFVIKPNTRFDVIEGKFGKSKCKVSVNGIERELWLNNDHLKN
ncbi:hypothetical protein [Capnocytophaga canimorsus]|uniref:hypothetical protein n=1 Tax=Capnocytophaga canimorsus TaxID=28188 RepID=UPI0037CD8E7D